MTPPRRRPPAARARGRARRLGGIVALLLLATTAARFPGDVADAATTRTLTISTASASPQVAFKNFDGNPPKVFDIDGDGDLEIVAQNDNQFVYVFDSRTGAIVFQVKTTFPPGWGARSFNGPEVTVTQEGGAVRLIVANSAAFLTSFRFDPGASDASNLRFTKEWEVRLNDCFGGASMDSKPVLADLDGDGSLEILAATEELGIYALRSNGQRYWTKCIGGGNAEPAVGDVNGDGWPDVVFGSDAGVVTAMNGRTAGTMWSYDARAAFRLGSGSMPVGATVAQLDGLGGEDVVVGARDSHDPDDWTNDHALLLALDGGGKLLWGRQDPAGNPLTYTRPIVVDAADDGVPEVYWGDWNTNGHKPPSDERDAWKVTGPGNFYRYDALGTMVWKQSLPTYWSNKDLALADVDADGTQEVLANGPGAGGDGIWYLDARTGAKESFVGTSPWKVSRGPVVADLWGGGTMQWIVAGEAATSSVSGGAILVFDTGQAYDSKWPHLPYPTAGAAPPAPTGSFDATFAIKAPNEWWQEVTVRPDTTRAIAKVEVRVNGGAWWPMSKSAWGAWTSSYPTPAGSQVEFLATDSNVALSQSAAFTWLDGTLTQRSVEPGTAPPPPPPPPPGAFSATFTVASGANEWWVEAGVDANQGLAGVDARANGGAWVALTKQNWGSWAASFFVAKCSAVEFRATATGGAQNVSRPFAWLDTGTCGPAAPFHASFTPKAVGNDWWVEAHVSANQPLASVSASVNGGPWTALAKQSWGSWAKSFFVPDGSEVRFQATNGSGATATSGTTVWT